MRLAALMLAGTLAIAAAAGSAVAGPRIADGSVLRARAVPACAGAGAYWPTMTLAVGGSTAWVACKEQARIVRISLPAGRKTGTVRLPSAVIAVTIGYGSVWALDDRSTLYRIDPRGARVTKEIALDTAAAYNIWTGAGAIWVADDQGAEVVRVSPSANKVIAHIPVGDGPADMVFAGGNAWVITHRDNTLFRIDGATNDVSRLATVAGGNAAAERLALLAGSIWITGRGMPLLEVDPDTGATRRSVDIHGTGIDVVATAKALWVPVRTEAVDRTGFPTMTALRRVTTHGEVTTAATARGRVDVHGLATGLGAVWFADNTGGFLYRLPA